MIWPIPFFVQEYFLLKIKNEYTHITTGNPSHTTTAKVLLLSLLQLVRLELPELQLLLLLGLLPLLAIALPQSVGSLAAQSVEDPG